MITYGEWKNEYGTSVSIDPFTNRGWGIDSLDMTESLGGSLAGGVLVLVGDSNSEGWESMDNTLEMDIIVKCEQSRGIKIHAVITSKKVLEKRRVILDFIAAPKNDFYTTKKVATWNSPREAFKKLWGGEIDIERCKNDIKFPPLYQQGKSDMEYLAELAYSYKKESVFAFGLDKFILKDLIGKDSTGKSEPYHTLIQGGKENFEQHGSDDVRSYDYDYKVYKKTYDPWENSGSSSKNIKVEILDGTYRMVAKDYEILRENANFNHNLMNSHFYGSAQTTRELDVSEQQLGDVVFLKKGSEKSGERQTSIYMVTQMSYHIKGHAFITKTYLRGLFDDETKEVLKETDPTGVSPQ